MSYGRSSPIGGYSGFVPESMQRPNSALDLNSKRSLQRFQEFKEKPPLDGYTGYIPKVNKEAPPPRLLVDGKIVKIRGYSGFIEGGRHVYGEPIIPCEEEQLRRIKTNWSPQKQRGYYDLHEDSKASSFDEKDPDLDLQERYLAAMEDLWHRGQTPQMLLRILQGKVSERVTDYSNELIRVRKLFEGFDSGKGWLDVPAFRSCIELIGCHLDETQSLALFSYFDTDNDGHVSWEELADHVIMHHPAGGKLVPKPITATMFTEDWHSLGRDVYL